MFNTPILLLIFNRPEPTAQLFSRIRNIQPAKLFVAADGPRDNNDKENCRISRQIATAVDWDCEVQTLFREENFGCADSVSQAISWFFSHVPAGIILEDDCLPQVSFFRYCHELLLRYWEDERIMMISGRNNLGKYPVDSSYFFAKFGSVWGWATWKRAWKDFNVSMSHWPAIKEKRIPELLINEPLVRDWRKKGFQQVADGKLNTWDIPWGLHMLLQNGLSVFPKVNLVKNIGYGTLATHTTDVDITDSIQTYELPFPLNHPDYVFPNHKFDASVVKIKRNKYKQSLSAKLRRKLIKTLLQR